MSNVECSKIAEFIHPWIGAFLTGRTFICAKDGLSYSQYQQCCGVPQELVLSPVLLNILLSSIPRVDGRSIDVYANDIAFYSWLVSTILKLSCRPR